MTKNHHHKLHFDFEEKDIKPYHWNRFRIAYPVTNNITVNLIQVRFSGFVVEQYLNNSNKKHQFLRSTLFYYSQAVQESLASLPPNSHIRFNYKSNHYAVIKPKISEERRNNIDWNSWLLHKVLKNPLKDRKEGYEKIVQFFFERK
jgi:hypothetical protein